MHTYKVGESLDYTLYDVVTSEADLMAGGSGLTDIYNDLGSGTAFGDFHFDPVHANIFIQIVLNSSAIAAINNSAGGLFAIGGGFSNASSDGRPGAFGASTFNLNNKLILSNDVVVPEPTSLALLGLGLAGFGFPRKKLC